MSLPENVQLSELFERLSFVSAFVPGSIQISARSGDRRDREWFTSSSGGVYRRVSMSIPGILVLRSRNLSSASSTNTITKYTTAMAR